MKKNILAALILSTLAMQVHATTQLNVWEDIRTARQALARTCWLFLTISWAVPWCKGC